MASEPTKAEVGVLGWAAHLEKTLDAALTTSRTVPLRVVDRCIERGWLRELDESVVMVDGDGFTLTPERYRVGYRLTDAGRALVKTEEERERARFDAMFAEKEAPDAR